ncbi:MAG: ribonuclease HII [Candidatus Micrarchaeota archaeon]|nr:ribonuclease HII [Candidatus Micrarchaeota archaeon]
MIVSGGDEAGRGSMLGPLVVSLVSVSKGMVRKLSDIGVRDSKMLTSRAREALYDQIREIASDIQVSKITPQEINDAMRKGVSLNELEAMHFAKMLDKIDGHVDVLYLDSPDVIPEKFGLRVKLSSARPVRVDGIKAERKSGVKPTKIVSEHKADSKYPVVSAASIIAKVTRDAEIRRLAEETGIKIGSGYTSDYVTIEAIREHRTDPKLKPHIREYWKTMQEIRQSRLFDYLQVPKGKGAKRATQA